MKKSNRKARVPVQDRSRKTKEKIIDAGINLFSDKGYHGTNAMEIAEAAGVSTGSFYSYFDDKMDLFLSIFTKYYQEIFDKVLMDVDLKMLIDADNKDIVHLFVDKMFKAHDISQSLHKEITAMIYLDERVKKRNDIEETKILDYIEYFLSLYKERLRITDLKTASYVILSISEQIIHSIKMFKTKQDEKKMLDQLEEVIYRYLF